MKVLVISAAFPPMRAGEADHTFHLCQHLADRGLDVHLLTTKSSVAATDLPFRVHPIMRDWSWSEIPLFMRFLKRCSPDAVLLHYIGWIYNNHPMVTFAPTLSRTFLPKTRFVTQFTNAIGTLPHRCSILTRCLRRGAKLCAHKRDVDYEFGTLLRDSDRIIVLSEHHSDILLKHYPPVSEKSILIPPPPLIHICPGENGASRQRSREALGVTPSEFLLVYFGLIYPGKGVETLLTALQLVQRRKSNVRLILLGGMSSNQSPDRERYAQWVHDMPRKLGIDDKVMWKSYRWDSDEASAYLRAADACVLPFDIGVQMNNSTLSAAAAHGLPIIATRGGKLEQPLCDQENIFLCPPKDPVAMASAIETLIDKPDLQQRLHVGVLKLAEEWLSWDNAVERTIATFS